MQKIQTTHKKGDEAMSENQNVNSNQLNDQGMIYGPSVFIYTSQEAVEDGILFDITTINPAWAKGLFNYVTTNLLGYGYLDKEGKINIPNLLDLLNQANQIVRKGTKNYTMFDTFFDGSVELPNGDQQKIFIGWNETGKFTIMLPADY